MTLLQKMGWNPGEGLGKFKDGQVEPLKVRLKYGKMGTYLLYMFIYLSICFKAVTNPDGYQHGSINRMFHYQTKQKEKIK